MHLCQSSGIIIISGGVSPNQDHVSHKHHWFSFPVAPVKKINMLEISILAFFFFASFPTSAIETSLSPVSALVEKRSRLFFLYTDHFPSLRVWGVIEKASMQWAAVESPAIELQSYGVMWLHRTLACASFYIKTHPKIGLLKHSQDWINLKGNCKPILSVTQYPCCHWLYIKSDWAPLTSIFDHYSSRSQ